MMQLLEMIEDSGIATWVRESPSLLAYTGVLSLHAIGLSIVVGISSIVALRVTGRFRSIPLEPMFQLFPVMWIGFWINALSGLMLLSANATGMLTMFMFYLKMAFVTSAVVLLMIIRRRFGNPDFAENGKRLAYALLGLWFCAIVTGRLTSYPYMIEAWFGV